MTEIEKYRPSSGTEGEWFMSRWCCQCQRASAMRESEPIEACAIVAATFLYSVDHPKYPDAWRYDKDGAPICDQFVQMGDPIPPEPDTLTRDLFEPEVAS
jgi:hypothetical protein